jgi:riboflavin biosynthesis pyrimidine reductase
VEVREVDTGGPLPIAVVLRELGDRGINNLLVEGGSKIFTSFIASGLYDQVRIFTSPMIIGQGISAVDNLGTRHIREAVCLEKPAWQILENGQMLFTGYKKGASCLRVL